MQTLYHITSAQPLNPSVFDTTEEKDLRKAVNLLNEDRTPEAIVLLENVVNRFPKSLRAHKFLAAAYVNNREFDKAFVVFKKVIAMAPNSADSHSCLGFLYVIKKEFDLGIAHFEKAIKYDPKEPKYKKQLSFAYYMKGFFHKELAEAYELQKDGVRAKSQYLTAKKQYESSLNIDGSSKAIFGYVEVCVKLGDLKNARVYLQKYFALTKDPQAAKILKHLGK